MAGSLYGGSITSTNVWLSRYQDESSSTYYAFYTDIWGTVSEFQSITLTSPLGNTYALSLSPEGDQWGNGIEGTQANITSEFTDGLYRFDVIYNDATTDSASARLGGVLPVFPSSISLAGNAVSWSGWNNPVSPSHIEILVSESGGGASEFSHLPFTDTSYLLPDGFLQNNTLYDIEVWFVSSEYPDGFKASGRVDTGQIINDDHPADTNGDHVIGDFELLEYIDKWASGLVEDFDLLDTIDIWAAGQY